MRTTAFVITVVVSLGATSLIASAQIPGPQAPGDPGWTTEDARKIDKRPYDIGYLVATVVKLSVRAKSNRFIVTLDNGQRWSQIENKPDVRVSVGDEIKVEKSTLGSYMLTTSSGIQTRVRRDR
jgi:hypothetical protein